MHPSVPLNENTTLLLLRFLTFCRLPYSFRALFLSFFSRFGKKVNLARKNVFFLFSFGESFPLIAKIEGPRLLYSRISGTFLCSYPPAFRKEELFLFLFQSLLSLEVSLFAPQSVLSCSYIVILFLSEIVNEEIVLPLFEFRSLLPFSLPSHAASASPDVSDFLRAWGQVNSSFLINVVLSLAGRLAVPLPCLLFKANFPFFSPRQTLCA